MTSQKLASLLLTAMPSLRGLIGLPTIPLNITMVGKASLYKIEAAEMLTSNFEGP